MTWDQDLGLVEWTAIISTQSTLGVTALQSDAATGGSVGFEKEIE